MSQSPTDTLVRWEEDETPRLPADSPGESESAADEETGENENPVIGREWIDFAGANEYGAEIEGPETETSAESVIGREWRDFTGTNEYRTDLSASE